MRKITLLMPVKNGERYLSESITNLLEIAGPNDEILVVDDHSNDGSFQIVNEFSKMDSRLNLIKNKEPGLVGALNLGLKESQNEWVARCDVDDQYAISRINEQRKQISDNTVAIFSDYTFFSDKNKNLGRIPSALTKEAVSISLSLSQRTAHPSVMYNKLAVENVGGYSIQDFPAEDLSLWLRLSRVGSLVSVEKNLLNYRLDVNSVSFQKRKEILIKKHQILEKIGVNYADYSFACNNLVEILKSYDGTELANQRKLLLIREIFTLKNNPNRYGISSKKIELLSNKAIFEILNYQTARDLYKLNSDRKKRNKIRG